MEKKKQRRNTPVFFWGGSEGVKVEHMIQHMAGAVGNNMSKWDRMVTNHSIIFR